MDFRLKLHSSVVSISFMLLLPALCFAGNDAYVSTRATYYGSPDCLGTASKYMHATHMYMYIFIYIIFIISHHLCQVELVDMENTEELLTMPK